MYMSTEDAIKRTLHDIDDMEKVNAALPIIKKVIASFDGKILNKRLDDALKAAGLPGHIYMTARDNSWDICYQPEKANAWYTILWGSKPSCQYYSKEKSFVDPDKRISAERAFTLIEAGRVERLQKITAYREHLTTWEAKKAQLEMLKKQLKTIADSVPYSLRDYFGMNVRYY
jgi:hypothetical protein